MITRPRAAVPTLRRGCTASGLPTGRGSSAYGQIWVMDQDGRNKTQLTRTPAPASNDNPVWSPDGTRLLFDTNRRGTAEIWVIDADGSNKRALIGDVRVMPARASWQPVRSSN